MPWRTAHLLTAVCLSAGAGAGLFYTGNGMNRLQTEKAQSTPTIFAAQFKQKPDGEGFPTAGAWAQADALRFDEDWQGQNADPGRATEVRVLWTPETLFLRFHCRFRDITVFPDSRPDGSRDELWNRDVAETFLQPEADGSRVYKEFEVSPNGYWIALAVSHGKGQELRSGVRRRVKLDEKAHTWTAELALSMNLLTGHFDPAHPWRANFFRIEGQTEPRFYSAWSPTHSPKPNFHVPEAFGTLAFRE